MPRVALSILNVLRDVLHVVPKTEEGDPLICKALLRDHELISHLMSFIITYASEPDSAHRTDLEFIAVHGMGLFQRMVCSQGKAMVSFDVATKGDLLGASGRYVLGFGS